MIAGLTPLRGIAALLVAMFHYELFVGPLWPTFVSPLTGKLYLMVDLFFVLSGFVILHVYGPTFSARIQVKSAFRYIRARFARVYPLHLMSLLVLVLLATVSAPPETLQSRAPYVFFDWNTLPLQLTMLHATWAANEADWNTPSWSISVEWWAYCAFPIIALCFARFGMAAKLAAVVLIVSGYVALTEYLQPIFWAERWERFGLDLEVVPYPKGTIDVVAGPAPIRGIVAFMLGMLAYEIWKSNRLLNVVRRGSVFVLMWAILFTGWATETLYDPVAVLIMAIIILSAASNSDWLQKPLNSRPLVFLGDTSYSIYLLHMPLLFTWSVAQDQWQLSDVTRRNFGIFGYDVSTLEAWIGFAAFLLCLLILSRLIFHVVERPARRMLAPSRHG